MAQSKEMRMVLLGKTGDGKKKSRKIYSKESKEMRMVLLGKTGDGKSSSGNTILGESSSTKFFAKTSPSSVTFKCEVQAGLVAGTLIKMVDTPGFFDTRLPESELSREVWKCITLNSPGPHAFLIVLRVGRYTEQEAATVSRIEHSFGEEAFRYAVVLFTHGNELDEDQTIEDFVGQSEDLKTLVQKCGGRCYVIDNKYWNQEHGYRSNRVQVERLLNTIEVMIAQNGGNCYSNKTLENIEREIQSEQQSLAEEMSSNTNDPEVRGKAEERVAESLFRRCGDLSVLSILGAFLGIGVICLSRLK